jgi:hypothetical protein
MGLILKVLTNVSRTAGERKAGRLGPNRIFLIPKYKSVRRIATAFCSYHDRIKERGSSLTPTLNALDKAMATCMAE